MRKELISDREGINLIILFMFGSTLVIGTGGQAKNDMWLSVLLGMLAALPVLFIYSRLLSSYPGKDLFDILFIVFGKVLGRVFIVFYIWFSFHLGALVLRNFAEFINTVALPETPKVFYMVLFAALSAYVVKEGIESLSKCVNFFIIIVIALLILFGFLTMSIMEPENLKPVLGNGIEPVLEGAFSAFSFPFAETVVLMAAFSSLKTRKSPYKVYLIGILIAGGFITYIVLRNTMVLGSSASASYFPSYTAVSRINIGDFFERLEIAVSMVFLLAGFVKISLCLLATCKGVSKLFGYENYRFIVIPIALLMINLSYILYSNIMEMFEWAFDIWPYYALVFQLFLPIIIFITSEIKLKSNKNMGINKT